MLRVYLPDPDQETFYAMGYGGNGVTYSAQVGRRMAQMVAGRSEGLDLPIFTSHLLSQGVLSASGPAVHVRLVLPQR